MAEPLFLRLGEVTSTQDAAAGLPVGSVVVADVQTSGRGRLGRSWTAAPNSALLVSFVCPSHPLGSLAAGVAAAEACGHGVRLKWPNDLLLGELKVGGILVEAKPGRMLVGIGINLGWSPPGATRLPAPHETLLNRLEEAIWRWFQAAPAGVLARWRELSATLGQRVIVELPGAVFEGVAEDIRADGALLVSGRAFAAGDVIHLNRPKPAPPASATPHRSGRG
jgi:BirA family biotin operon repressor/biotin-[acetyl-CoA-carboxylase] ligase